MPRVKRGIATESGPVTINNVRTSTDGYEQPMGPEYLCLYYEDHAIDTMDDINYLLAKHGLVFEHDAAKSCEDYRMYAFKRITASKPDEASR